MPIVRLTHNISSALHIGLNIVERVQTLLVVLHIVCVYYTTDVMDDISLLVSLSPNPNPAERLQEKGSNGKRFDFFFIRTFFRSILFPDPDLISLIKNSKGSIFCDEFILYTSEKFPHVSTTLKDLDIVFKHL